MRSASGYNSSFVVDLSMWQIPRSTERTSSFCHKKVWHRQLLHRVSPTLVTPLCVTEYCDDFLVISVPIHPEYVLVLLFVCPLFSPRASP